MILSRMDWSRLSKKSRHVESVSKRRVQYMCIHTQWGCPTDGYGSSSIVSSKKSRRVPMEVRAFGFEKKKSRHVFGLEEWGSIRVIV